MRQEEIEGRIQNLEVGLQTVMIRLESLERSETPKQAPVPPPVIEPLPIRQQQVLKPEPPKVPVKVPSFIQEVAEQVLPPRSTDDPYTGFGNSRPYSTPQPKADADEIEYKFGINGLLRGGAVVIVCAVLFLVGTALSRGWITPTMQFIGEVLLCFGFIGIGIAKHKEREDFGQLMAGIGSFGLYASFAGAFAYKHLFEGEMLVSLFMLLSLANLGFSHWKASKSFLCLGMIGGLVSAVMPMRQDKAMLDLALHFTILAPCAMIIIRNKWNGMASLMWVASSVALLPVATSNLDMVYRVGAVYLSGTVALFASGKAFKQSSFDPYAAVQGAMVFATAVMSLMVDSGQKGSLHTLALVALGSGVAYLNRDNKEVRNATIAGSVAVLTILTPIGFTQNVAAFIYGIESLALVGLALRYQNVTAIGMSLATLACSFCAYSFDGKRVIPQFVTMSGALETLLLGIFAATIVLNAVFAVRKAPKEVAEVSMFFAGSLVVGIFIRVLNIWLGYGNTPLQTGDIVALGIATTSLATLGLSWRIKRTGLFLVSLFLGIFSTVIAMIFETLHGPSWVAPTLVLMATGTVILSSRYILANEDDSYQEPTLVLAGLIVSAFFLRLFAISGADKLMRMSHDGVIVLGLAILNLVWTAFAVARRRPAYTILGWASFAVTAVSAMVWNSASDPSWLSPVALIVPILSIATLYWVRDVKEEQESALASLFAFAEWALVSCLVVRELNFGLKEMAAITMAWVLVATVLIILGFAFQRRYLRYWSLAIFMVTVAKVFLIDLAELDSFVRVLCLMLLGVGMVGGGYWYILWRRSHTLPGGQS